MAAPQGKPEPKVSKLAGEIIEYLRQSLQNHSIKVLEPHPKKHLAEQGLIGVWISNANEGWAFTVDPECSYDGDPFVVNQLDLILSYF